MPDPDPAMDAAAVLRDERTPRRLRARWVLQGTLVLQTAAHLGGAPEDGTLDAPVLRVRIGGEPRPLLTGTSLGGALRSHLADLLGGYRTKEDDRVQRLFGMPLGVEEEKRGEQSPLLVFDAVGRLPDGLATEIRDGVAIEPASGTAEERLKFDQELLPPGTTFRLRVDLVVAEQLGEAGEAELLGLLVATLDGLGADRRTGAVTIGARGSRGRGAASMRGWRAHRFDLTSASGWLAWLTSDPAKPLPAPGPRPAPTIAEAVHEAAPDLAVSLPDDLRRRVVIEADLKLRAGLLVRSPADEPAAPDAAHLASGGKSILPGTSLAGTLRTRLLRIARLVRERHGDAERWIERLLGPRPQPGRRDEQVPLWASRLRAAERRLHDDGRRVRTTRIRIDRFTQGVVAGALFDEEPHDGGTVQVRIELREPEPGELGLVLLGLKDLLSGDLPLGGTVAVGRGTVTGTATVQLDDQHTTLRLRPGGAEDERSLTLADELIREFHEAPALPPSEPEQTTAAASPAPAGGSR